MFVGNIGLVKCARYLQCNMVDVLQRLLRAAAQGTGVNCGCNGATIILAPKHSQPAHSMANSVCYEGDGSMVMR